jgi:hypothetical protein
MDLAKWEYSRLKENIALDKPNGSDITGARHNFLMNQIREDLIKFGMREELVEAAVGVLGTGYNNPARERTAIFLKMAPDAGQLTVLREYGLIPQDNQVNFILSMGCSGSQN